MRCFHTATRDHSTSGWSAGAWEDNSHETFAKTARKDLLSKLQSLFGFRSGIKFTILLRALNMDIDHKTQLSHILEGIIPAIFSTLKRLQRGGYKIKFKLSF